MYLKIKDTLNENCILLALMLLQTCMTCLFPCRTLDIWNVNSQRASLTIDLNTLKYSPNVPVYSRLTKFALLLCCAFWPLNAFYHSNAFLCSDVEKGLAADLPLHSQTCAPASDITCYLLIFFLLIDYNFFISQDFTTIARW